MTRRQHLRPHPRPARQPAPEPSHPAPTAPPPDQVEPALSEPPAAPAALTRAQWEAVATLRTTAEVGLAHGILALPERVKAAIAIANALLKQTRAPPDE